MTKTTIQLESEVKAELNKLGRRGESYNDILKRMIKSFKRTKEADQ